MLIACRTHCGHNNRRNEDRLLIRSLGDEKVLLLIADGLGGHPGGDVAAGLVVDTISARLEPAGKLTDIDLEQLILEAGEKIMRHGTAHPAVDGMGSTATLALVEPHRVQWAHVGDCRIYLCRNSRLQCMTRDQTLARQMFELGEIDFAEVRQHKLNHFLTQCLGEEDVEPERGTFAWGSSDTLLLTSDGLHNMLEDLQIEAVLNEETDIERKADKLLEQTLAAGGTDNISFIICMNSGG